MQYIVHNMCTMCALHSELCVHYIVLYSSRVRLFRWNVDDNNMILLYFTVTNVICNYVTYVIMLLALNIDFCLHFYLLI